MSLYKSRKTQFETAIPVNSQLGYRFYQARALDSTGKVIGVSDVFAMDSAGWRNVPSVVLLWSLAFIGLVLGSSI